MEMRKTKESVTKSSWCVCLRVCVCVSYQLWSHSRRGFCLLLYMPPVYTCNTVSLLCHTHAVQTHVHLLHQGDHSWRCEHLVADRKVKQFEMMLNCSEVSNRLCQSVVCYHLFVKQLIDRACFFVSVR